MTKHACNTPKLKLYNTMARKKEVFEPRDDKNKKVKMFTCGPSIYQRAHIGNYRTFLFEDILIRYLEHLGYNVERVLNFTDVEDKAVEQAKRKGKDIKKLTNEVADKFLEEVEQLHLKPPTYNPRSSTTVDQSLKLIKSLMKKGLAYKYEGDVYFDPVKFDGFGKLYGLDMSLWPKKKKRFKKDTYPGMRWNLGDFILWHGCSNGDKVCWDDELGAGRPSWNVQDPAMATKYLGYKIDICCGGIDNLYRHHDYNLAVVEGVSGETFAPFWLHGAHLFAYGKKMSKSIGNIIYLDDLIKDDFEPEHVRFYLIYGHYRERLNFTKRGFEETAELLNEFRSMVLELTNLDSAGTKSDNEVKDMIKRIVPNFEECLNNDLDVKCAFDDLVEVVAKLLELKNEKKLNRNDCNQIKEELERIDSILQVIFY